MVRDALRALGLLVLVAASFAVVGCGNNPSDTQEPITGESILAEVHEAMGAAASWRLIHQMTSELSVPDVTWPDYQATVAFAAPDRFHVLLEAGDEVSESISVGDRTFRRNMPDGDWRVLSIPSLPDPLPDILPTLDEVTLVGEQMLDGEQVYLLEGSTEVTSYSLLVGVEDMLVREMTALVERTLEAEGYGEGETVQQTAVLRFDGYNEPVTIEPPDEYADGP